MQTSFLLVSEPLNTFEVKLDRIEARSWFNWLERRIRLCVVLNVLETCPTLTLHMFSTVHLGLLTGLTVCSFICLFAKTIRTNVTAIILLLISSTQCLLYILAI